MDNAGGNFSLKYFFEHVEKLVWLSEAQGPMVA